MVYLGFLLHSCSVVKKIQTLLNRGGWLSTSESQPAAIQAQQVVTTFMALPSNSGVFYFVLRLGQPLGYRSTRAGTLCLLANCLGGLRELYANQIYDADPQLVE